MFNREKIDFLHLPTPLEFLPRISQDLGVNFYIKRDDLTGLGVGGNKLRKLEYFLEDAQKQGATMLLTVGGVQTNHGRLTAAVAAKYGMKCAIIAVDKYPGEVSANVLLDRIMGADLIIKETGNHDDPNLLDETVAKIKSEYEAQEQKVYYIPMGGSNELGVSGYYDCTQEIIKQTHNLNLKSGRIIVPVGSMGTYMGVFCGLHHGASHNLELTGISIMPYKMGAINYACDYYAKVKKYYDLPLFYGGTDFHIEEDYTFGSYNNPVAEVRQAIYQMARREAVILDPCYTGKCFAGVNRMIEEGKIKKGENIIFIHTGGLPGINTPHHRSEFQEELKSRVRII